MYIFTYTHIIFIYTHIHTYIQISWVSIYIYSKKQPGCWPLCLAILHDVYVSKVTFYGNGIGDVRQGSRPWLVRISWHHSPAADCEAWELVIGGLEKDLGNDYCHTWGNSLEVGVSRFRIFLGQNMTTNLKIFPQVCSGSKELRL